MLTRHHPYRLALRIRLTETQAIECLTIKRQSQSLRLTALAGLRKSDQVGMAFHRVGRKVGEVHLVFTAVVFDNEVLAIEHSVDAKPDFTIIAGNCPIVLPTTLVGSSRSIVYQVAAIKVPDISGAKVKPLVKLGLVVAANRKLHS